MKWAGLPNFLHKFCQEKYPLDEIGVWVVWIGIIVLVIYLLLPNSWSDKSPQPTTETPN